MANGWTPERRARAAEQIRTWRPWEKSTGPRTDEGKATSSANALKHGARSAEAIECARRINGWLRKAREARQVRDKAKVRATAAR